MADKPSDKPEQPSDHKVDRRAFLKVVGAASAVPLAASPVVALAADDTMKGMDMSGGKAAAPAAPDAAAKPAASLPAGYQFFNINESGFVEAAVDTLIPHDNVGPGALELGVATYIDRQMAGAYGKGDRMWLAGPYGEGTPQQGWQFAMTPAEFIKAGIDKPGSLTIADSGVGTTNHIVAELLSAGSGAKYTLVHYKGSGQASIDVIAGQVPAQIDQLNSAIGHIKAGKLRPLAVTSAKRLPELPDVPTVAESGIKGYEVLSWNGISAPAKTPKPVIEKLSSAVNKVINSPEVKANWAKQGAVPMGMTPDQFGKFMRADIQKWARLVKETGMKVH